MKMSLRQLLFVSLLICAVPVAATAECHPPSFKGGPDLINPDTGEGELRIAVRLDDISIESLACLAETLRSQHAGWRNVGVLIFRSKIAAYNFRAADVDYSGPVPGPNPARQLLASYFLNIHKHENFLTIDPLGYGASPSLESRIDLPLKGKPRCRVELNNRCIVFIERIDYPLKALHARASGSLTLEGTLKKDGRVRAVHVVRSNFQPAGEEVLFSRAAIRNLSQWRIDPAAHESSIRITYSYVLEKDVGPGQYTDVEFELPGKITIHGKE